MRSKASSPRLPPAVGLLLGGALLQACGAQPQRGQTLYQEGRHIEAAEVFELTEGRLGASGAQECTCYGLYRGLNFLKLGDLRSARRWLDYAADLERRHPGMLSADERELLARAWQELKARAQAGHQARPEGGVAASPVPATAHVPLEPARGPQLVDQ